MSVPSVPSFVSMPCPPAPRKGYTQYYDTFGQQWIYVKKI